MARVPYQPFATAQPESPGERISVSTPGAAFGENIAQAVEHVGGDMTQVGGELFSRAIAIQDLQNEKDARDAGTALTTKVAQQASEFESLEGQAAKDALPGFLKGVDDARITGRAALRSPNAQRMYDADTSAIQRSVTMLAARHAGEQFKQGVIASNKAAMDVDAQTWTDPKNQSEYNDKLARLRTRVQSNAAIQNYTPEQEADLELHEVSRLRSEQIGALAKSGDIDSALAIMEGNRKDLTQKDFESISSIVYGQNRIVGAAKLVQSIYSPDKTYAEMEKEVRGQAPTYAHGDPLFEQDAVRALQTRDNQTKFTLERDKQANRQTVEGAFRDADSMQQLLADPVVAKAYHQLPSSEQNAIPGKLMNSKKQFTTEEGYSNFIRLKGMSQSDPESFLEANVFDPDLKLSVDQRQSLLNIREKQMKNPTDDLRVTRAMSLLRSARGGQMQGLGIYRRDVNNPDDYDHFVGALQEALEVWQQDHKGRPTDADIIDSIGPTVLRTAPVSTYFGLSHEDRLLSSQFERGAAIPEDYRQKLTDKVVKAGGIIPTEQQLRQAYARDQFNKLYGGSGGSTATQSDSK